MGKIIAQSVETLSGFLNFIKFAFSTAESRPPTYLCTPVGAVFDASASFFQAPRAKRAVKNADRKSERKKKIDMMPIARQSVGKIIAKSAETLAGFLNSIQNSLFRSASFLVPFLFWAKTSFFSI